MRRLGAKRLGSGKALRREGTEVRRWSATSTADKKVGRWER